MLILETSTITFSLAYNKFKTMLSTQEFKALSKEEQEEYLTYYPDPEEYNSDEKLNLE